MPHDVSLITSTIGAAPGPDLLSGVLARASMPMIATPATFHVPQGLTESR